MLNYIVNQQHIHSIVNQNICEPEHDNLETIGWWYVRL